LYISNDGTILGCHRKLVPTAGERLVYAQGDGSTLAVYTTPFGRLGGLICWENYMPLARYSMYAWGVEIYVAPTWDRGEPWLSTVRHIAKEGRVYIISCCSAMRRADIPERLLQIAPQLAGSGEWVNPGDSLIVDPDGKVLAGPVHERTEIVYAELDPAKLRGPRFQLDVAGHYGRPDVFELTVHREARPMLRIAEGPSRQQEKDMV
jgi:nitrilase